MTAVKFLHSAMSGAPTLNGTAGTMIAVLDACLVNGFGSGNVDSIVIAGGVATVTRSAGHPMEVGSIAEIAGGSVSGGSINGQKRVLTVPSPNTYTFDATGIADQTATGTITHKLAPLGWTKEFSGTNLAVYKSPNVAATGCRLRVDDTGTTNARVVGYESMTDVNTGSGPFPTSAQISGGGYWGKSNTADTTVRPWIVVGDDRAFYVCVQWTGSVSYGTHGFGDFNSNKSPDPYACFLSVASSSIVASAPGSIAGADIAHCYRAAAVSQAYLPRGTSGLGSATSSYRCVMSSPVGADDGVFSGASASQRMLFPNPADNGLYLSLMSVVDNSAFRGTYPGAYHVPQIIGTGVFSNRDSVGGVTGYSGRTFKAVLNSTGVMFFDVTGPWR